MADTQKRRRVWDMLNTVVVMASYFYRYLFLYTTLNKVVNLESALIEKVNCNG